VYCNCSSIMLMVLQQAKSINSYNFTLQWKQNANKNVPLDSRDNLWRKASWRHLFVCQYRCDKLSWCLDFSNWDCCSYSTEIRLVHICVLRKRDRRETVKSKLDQAVSLCFCYFDLIASSPESLHFAKHEARRENEDAWGQVDWWEQGPDLLLRTGSILLNSTSLAPRQKVALPKEQIY